MNGPKQPSHWPFTSLAVLIGVVSMVALATGHEGDVYWLVVAMFGVLSILSFKQVRQMKDLTVLYPGNIRRKVILTVELVCVLTGLSVVVGR